jgi:hypothetical protein
MVDLLRKLSKRSLIGAFAFLLALTGIGGTIAPKEAGALTLNERSLHIRSGLANEATRHTYSFTYATLAVDVGSIKFEYCTSPLPVLPCSAPPGMDANGAVLAEQAGETGYGLVSAGVNQIVIGRSPDSPSTLPISRYAFDNVVNPDGVPMRQFYVRITTYQTSDASGPETDFGAVVNAITGPIDVSAEVPPLLNFCVGITIPGDCSTATDNLIDLGDLSANNASSGTSQMMVGTNAAFGVAIAVHGTTMTSGNNTLPPLPAPTPSAPGNSQFGLNLRSNSNPGIGQEPVGAGVATPTASYNIPNRYTFNSGDIVAVSAGVTDLRKFTASYVVNISPSQAPGVYTATLTYICSATF